MLKLIQKNFFRSDNIYSDLKSMPSQDNTKLKLVLLCHSSIVEAQQERNTEEIDQSREVYEDEFGKCFTFSKISISMYDRVITLKKIIETKFDISTKDQILVYKDTILKNDLRSLHTYNLRQYSRIHIFDERDLKENVTDIDDDDLYGIYQELNLAPATYSNQSRLDIKNKTRTQKGTRKERSVSREHIDSRNKSVAPPVPPPPPPLQNEIKKISNEKLTSSSQSSTTTSNSSSSNNSSQINYTNNNRQRIENHVSYSRKPQYQTYQLGNTRQHHKLNNQSSRFYEQHEMTLMKQKLATSSLHSHKGSQYNVAPTRYRKLDEIFSKGHI